MSIKLEAFTAGTGIVIRLVNGIELAGVYHHTYAPKDNKSDAHVTILVDEQPQSFAVRMITEVREEN